MKSKEIIFSKEEIKESRHQGYSVYGTLKGYCDLHSSCSTCNAKVRFLCKVKIFIENVQTKIVNKISK